MKLLIDECLHTSLVDVAQQAGHDAFHVNWLGLSGEADWDLMPKIVAEDFTFVTNNAADFRKLYRGEAIHAGLIIIVPQVAPARQRELLAAALAEAVPGGDLINQVIEIVIADGEIEILHYELPAPEPENPDA